MVSVASPSQVSITAPHSCHAPAARCHWSWVVCLYATGSNVAVPISSSVTSEGGLPLFDPAEDLRAVHSCQDCRVVGTHVGLDGSDDLFVVATACHEPALASN